ncbi:MAG: hypothetical protein CMJ39_12680 [Phycisphaerae bacterium]|nr:hypothetical protein [Phycisphaerae bacterium]
MLILIFSLIAGVLGHAHPAEHPDSTDSAKAFIESLDDEQMAQAVYSFEDSKRLHWMYLPGARAGLPLRDMNKDQRKRANDLLATMLSEHGMRDLEGIYAMELALREQSRRRGHEDPTRDPDQYELAIFGTPGEPIWAWHYEGHHLSLNFTHINEEVCVTPLFIGVAPFELPEGPLQGTRVLGDESDLAFKFMQSLDDEQRKQAILSDRTPHDILTMPGRENRLNKPEGLKLGTLNMNQKMMAMAILESYARILQGPVAQIELDRITQHGLDNLHFAWMGKLTPDQSHYFRLQGPSFILEYDCVGGDPEHVHMVWHDPERNMGADPLKRHHERHHPPSSENEDTPSRNP